jgi:hypothetical protein
MFPAPVDHGIAQPDRAVSGVPFGTSSYLEGSAVTGRRGTRAAAREQKAVAEIVVYRRRADSRRRIRSNR